MRPSARSSARERHQHIDHPHQDDAPDPREQRREHADRHAGHQREADHADADQQRHARGIDDARQRIAAELVGAEPVRGARVA